MPDYKKMYLRMFSAATDVHKQLLDAAAILREAQQECEEQYIKSDDISITLPEAEAQSQ